MGYIYSCAVICSTTSAYLNIVTIIVANVYTNVYTNVVNDPVFEEHFLCLYIMKYGCCRCLYLFNTIHHIYISDTIEIICPRCYVDAVIEVNSDVPTEEMLDIHGEYFQENGYDMTSIADGLSENNNVVRTVFVNVEGGKLIQTSYYKNNIIELVDEFSPDDTCVICHDDFVDTFPYRFIRCRCRTYYHDLCLYEYIRSRGGIQNTTCTTCRHFGRR